MSANLFPQTITSGGEVQSRTAVITASFTKFKNVTKSKHGITKSKYRRVESEAAVRTNPADYSGSYQVPDLGFALQLRVDGRGVVTGSGNELLEGSVRRTFTLRNGIVRGALLTATKVYANGETERLEGAFMNRTSFESPSDKGTTTFGFGTLGKPVEVSGMTINKFFYERSQ